MNDLLYVNNLIKRALKTVRATTGLQASDSGQQEDALQLLNEILAEMNSDGGLLPFQVMQPFNLQVGKSTYTVGTIVGADVSATPFAEINYVDLIIDNIRFPVAIQNDFSVLGHGVSLINQGRPGWVRIIRGDGFDTFEFYDVPDRNYACEVRGKKETGTVAFQDYINLPSWYARYLRLALARSINSYFELAAWSEIKEKEFLEAESNMLASAKKDWTIKTDAPFQPGRGIRTYRLGVVS